MPAFARAILIQESAEGGLSYKVKKRPLSHHKNAIKVSPFPYDTGCFHRTDDITNAKLLSVGYSPLLAPIIHPIQSLCQGMTLPALIFFHSLLLKYSFPKQISLCICAFNSSRSGNFCSGLSKEYNCTSISFPYRSPSKSNK